MSVKFWSKYQNILLQLHQAKCFSVPQEAIEIDVNWRYKANLFNKD